MEQILKTKITQCLYSNGIISEWFMYEGDAKYGVTYDHTGNRVSHHI